MSSPADAVSIELRNLDPSLERESAKEDGGHKSTYTSKWPAIEEILNPREPTILFLPMWDKIFKMLCALGVFIDPLYCYIFNTDEEITCYFLDEHLLRVYAYLRSAIDLFYLMDIIIFLCGRVCSERKAKRWGLFHKKSDHSRGSSKRERSSKASFYLRILHGIFLALPIPQVALYGPWYNEASYAVFVYALAFITPIQYILRVCRIYGLLMLRPNLVPGISRRLQAVSDFLPFILAAYLFGALWYLLVFFRLKECWYQGCQGCHSIGVSNPFLCGGGIFVGGSARHRINATHIKASCPIDRQDPYGPTHFDFGIFLYALQSNVTTSSTNLPLKMSQCFWFALRHLSSFGSNLQTSLHIHIGEIVFSILISISGIVLFLIYLNQRVKVAQKRSDLRKLRKKMQMMNPDIDLWLYKNGLSDKDLKTLIMKNLQQKLEENKDVDVENILSILPVIHKRRIMCLLGLASIRKVSILENMDQCMLKAICEHLKLVIYTEDNYIIREGEPLEKMLFIRQGTACSYTTSANAYVGGSTSIGSSNIKYLQKGDFYGEELLNWASNLATYSDFPNSTRTVKSQTKVEAFTIMANDLKSIVSKFKWHFMERGKKEDSAASFIQTKWHARPFRCPTR